MVQNNKFQERNELSSNNENISSNTENDNSIISSKQKKISKKKNSKTFNIACKQCRSIHKKCCGQRPCKRCIDSGKCEECCDVERKRRTPKKKNNSLLDVLKSEKKFAQLCSSETHAPCSTSIMNSLLHSNNNNNINNNTIANVNNYSSIQMNKIKSRIIKASSESLSLSKNNQQYATEAMSHHNNDNTYSNDINDHSYSHKYQITSPYKTPSPIQTYVQYEKAEESPIYSPSSSEQQYSPIYLSTRRHSHISSSSSSSSSSSHSSNNVEDNKNNNNYHQTVPNSPNSPNGSIMYNNNQEQQEHKPISKAFYQKSGYNYNNYYFNNINYNNNINNSFVLKNDQPILQNRMKVSPFEFNHSSNHSNHHYFHSNNSPRIQEDVSFNDNNNNNNPVKNVILPSFNELLCTLYK